MEHVVDRREEPVEKCFRVALRPLRVGHGAVRLLVTVPMPGPFSSEVSHGMAKHGSGTDGPGSTLAERLCLNL